MKILYVLGSNLQAKLGIEYGKFVTRNDRKNGKFILLENERSSCLLTFYEKSHSKYRLNCDNLCTDFYKGLEFRFSWGFSAIINRFPGEQNHKLAIVNEEVWEVGYKIINTFLLIIFS